MLKLSEVEQKQTFVPKLKREKRAWLQYGSCMMHSTSLVMAMAFSSASYLFRGRGFHWQTDQEAECKRVFFQLPTSLYIRACFVIFWIHTSFAELCVSLNCLPRGQAEDILRHSGESLFLGFFGIRLDKGVLTFSVAQSTQDGKTAYADPPT